MQAIRIDYDQMGSAFIVLMSRDNIKDKWHFEETLSCALNEEDETKDARAIAIAKARGLEFLG